MSAAAKVSQPATGSGNQERYRFRTRVALPEQGTASTAEGFWLVCTYVGKAAQLNDCGRYFGGCGSEHQTFVAALTGDRALQRVSL